MLITITGFQHRMEAKYVYGFLKFVLPTSSGSSPWDPAGRSTIFFWNVDSSGEHFWPRMVTEFSFETSEGSVTLTRCPNLRTGPTYFCDDLIWNFVNRLSTWIELGPLHQSKLYTLNPPCIRQILSLVTTSLNILTNKYLFQISYFSNKIFESQSLFNSSVLRIIL